MKISKIHWNGVDKFMITYELQEIYSTSIYRKYFTFLQEEEATTNWITERTERPRWNPMKEWGDPSSIAKIHFRQGKYSIDFEICKHNNTQHDYIHFSRFFLHQVVENKFTNELILADLTAAHSKCHKQSRSIIKK